MSNIADALINLGENDEENNVQDIDTDDSLEEIENPQYNNMTAANETMLLDNNNVVNIAHGEGAVPLSLLMDDHCEELAHPHLFPTGKFGYKVDRVIKLSPSKYFNQRLLNYKQLFSGDSDYIFFATFYFTTDKFK